MGQRNRSTSAPGLYCLGTVLGWGNALGTRLTKPSGSEDEKACVASISVLFRSKERGGRVKDRAKNGASRRGRESVGVGNDLGRLRIRLREITQHEKANLSYRNGGVKLT